MIYRYINREFSSYTKKYSEICARFPFAKYKFTVKTATSNDNSKIRIFLHSKILFTFTTTPNIYSYSSTRSSRHTAFTNIFVILELAEFKPAKQKLVQF